MTKVLLINCSEENIISDTNKGAEAVIIATVNLLGKAVPDAVFTSFLNCSGALARELKLRVVRMKHSPYWPRFLGEIKSSFNLLNCLLWAGARKYLHADWRFLIKGARLREYAAADIIVYVGMDYYSEDIGTRVVLQHSRDIWLGVLLGRPVAVWAISAGPFRSRLARFAVRFVMNRVALITVRDSLSRDFMIAAGVEPSRVNLTSDPAFLFPPAPAERVEDICRQAGLRRNGGVVIGVNPSHSFIIPSHEKETAAREKYLKIMGFFGSFLASLLPEALFNRILGLVKRSFLYTAVDSRYDDYKAFFARLVNWLIETYGATVLLIAHDQAMAQLFDDRVVTGEIKKAVPGREGIVTIGQGYSAAEIKGIIGGCDLFIGARFHATLAALSQGVPSVCFPYYHKFSLLADLGQAGYICQSYTLEEARAKVADAWARREEIRRELDGAVKRAEELAALNGELVRRVLASRNAGQPPEKG